MSSWSDREDAAERVRRAVLAGDREEALRLLSEKAPEGSYFAGEVLETLARDIRRVTG